MVMLVDRHARPPTNGAGGGGSGGASVPSSGFSAGPAAFDSDYDDFEVILSPLYFASLPNVAVLLVPLCAPCVPCAP
jgi:hypothetical protein